MYVDIHKFIDDQVPGTWEDLKAILHHLAELHGTDEIDDGTPEPEETEEITKEIP